MDWFWWIVTALFILLIAGAWWWIGHRNHLLTRAEHTTPEDAVALRDVQRQIDQGKAYGDLL